MKRVAILGAGGHALVVVDILKASGGFDIIGCIADDTGPESNVAGVPLIGTMDLLESFPNQNIAVVVGVGGWTDTSGRRKIYERAVRAGVDIVGAIHPTACISESARLGMGCVLFAGATINPRVTIGDNVVVATNSSVDHETSIGNHSLISAGVTIGARCTIANDSLIAIGATVASRTSIGKHSLIAAGSVVVADVSAFAKVSGVPAKER